MNRNWLAHGLWILTAIAAFFIGSQLPSDKGSTESSAPLSRLQAAGEPDIGIGDPDASLFGYGHSSLDLESGAALIATLSDSEIGLIGEQLRTSSSPIERRLAFSRLLESLTAENALLIREQIVHLGDRSAEFREFHYAWGAVGAMDAVMFGADTEGDDMSPALAGWASADPSAARAWLDTLDMENNAGFDALLNDRKIPADELRNHLMRGLIKGMANADPMLASRFVHDEVSDGNEAAYGMIHGVVESVLRTGTPAEAAEWAQALEDGRLREAAMGHVAGQFVSKDPESALEWAASVADQPEGAGVIARVGGTLAKRDPQAAISWLNELPAGNGQNVGMHVAMREWTGSNPTAASQFLIEMPASPAKDSAISGFSRRLAWEDPQAAITWAQTISSDKQRTETLIEAGRAWNRKQPTNAALWLNGSGLPADVQEAILTPPKRDRD